MSTNKKSLIQSQIFIVLWLLLAAITAIESFAQFQKGGLSNPRVYFFSVLFLVCAYMYFRKKKQRFEEKK
jgi:hypothetical protein